LFEFGAIQSIQYLDQVISTFIRKIVTFVKDMKYEIDKMFVALIIYFYAQKSEPSYV